VRIGPLDTGPRRPSQRRGGTTASRRGRSRPIGALVLGVLLAIAGPTCLGMQSDLGPPPTFLYADLDGDAMPEEIRVTPGAEGIMIVDGDTTYRSRAKWRVVDAIVADADRDGTPEVVAILDDEEGRHIGLIAWRHDRYRERLVTSPLVPRPVGLRVRSAENGEGDLIVLTETSGAEVHYRWNGFGFKAMRTDEPEGGGT